MRMFAAIVVFVVAICVLTASASVATHDTHQGASAKSITVKGVVHNAGGEPISGTDIYLDDEKKIAKAHAVSADDGSFKLTVDHGGTYTVRAQKSGWTGDQSDPIELPRDAGKRIELVMENSRSPGTNSEDKSAAAG